MPFLTSSNVSNRNGLRNRLTNHSSGWLTATADLKRSPLAPLGENQALKTDTPLRGYGLTPHYAVNCGETYEPDRV